jgi:hypothetical protein
MFAWTRRKDTLSALAGSDADIQVLYTDATGRLYVNTGGTSSAINDSLTGPITAGQVGAIVLAKNIYDGNFYTIHTTAMDVDAQSASERGLNTRAHLEAFNGTTYDRLRVDANKNLLVSLNTLLSGEDTSNGRIRVENKPADADSVQETMQNAAVAIGNGTAVNVKGYGRLTLYCSLAGTATVTFEGTVDDTNYVAIGMAAVATGVVATTATATGMFYLPAGFSLSQVRARISAWTSGAVTVTSRKQPR